MISEIKSSGPYIGLQVLLAAHQRNWISQGLLGLIKQKRQAAKPKVAFKVRRILQRHMTVRFRKDLEKWLMLLVTAGEPELSSASGNSS